MAIEGPLTPVMGLVVDLIALAVSLAIFFTWVYPKLRRLEYRRFIEAWMALAMAGGVVALVNAVDVLGTGPITVLVNLTVAMVLALALGLVLFRIQIKVNARHASAS